MKILSLFTDPVMRSEDAIRGLCGCIVRKVCLVYHFKLATLLSWTFTRHPLSTARHIVWLSRSYDVLIHIMTSSNGHIFCVTDPLWGESSGLRWIPRTKDSIADLWFFLDLRLNKPLSKQSRRRRFATQSRSLWRHCNALWKRWAIPVTEAPFLNKDIHINV